MSLIGQSQSSGSAAEMLVSPLPDIPVQNLLALLLFSLMCKIPVRQTPVELHEDLQ